MIDAELRAQLAAQGIEGQILLVAVSGGRDSVVLLDALHRLAPEHDLALVVGHVDHGLRGDASTADHEFVASLARQAGLPFASRRVDPEAARRDLHSRARPTLEEAARSLRRAALLAMADEAGAAAIATAHHLGDQAETVLLRLLRGTGPDGLAAMAPLDRSGRWLRPLLDVPPEALAAAATARGLRWREDASNVDRRFARNRLRHDWIPGLAEAFNPQLLRNLADLAEAQRTDLEWIEGRVAEAAKERIEVEPRGVRLAIDGWKDVPEALARRLVRTALQRAGLGRDVSRRHLERMLAFLHRGRAAGRDLRLQLPAGIVLRRLDDAFLLEREPRPGKIAAREDATVPRRD